MSGFTPAFADPAARARWDDYFGEVERLLGRGEGAAELRAELAAHAAEAMAAEAVAGGGGSERERLEAALARLGRPADYLADDLIARGTASYNPVTIARGLFHAMLAGTRRAAIAALFGLGYLLLGIFVIVAVMKPLWSEHVGVFRAADGSLSGGILSDTGGGEELLGLWSIPLSLALAALLYVALTKGLRALRARR